MKRRSLLLVVVAASVAAAACRADRTDGPARTSGRQLRAECYSLITLGDRTGSITDLDDSGRVLVTSAMSAFVWHAGKATELLPLGSSAGVTVADMNNRGEVVGESGSSAVLWTEGAALAIPTAGVRATARAINDLGHVVGGYEDAAGQWHAFVFREGATTELAAPGRSVVATSINNGGEIVAYELTGPLDTDGAIVRGLLFREGALTVLGDAFVWPTNLQINARGQVLGNARVGDGRVHPMLWTDGVLRDLASGVEGDVRGHRLNDRGDVVGSRDEPLTLFPFHTELPVLWSGGVARTLPITTLAGAPLDLDERGNVVGYMFWRTGSRAALWNDGGSAVLPDLSGPSALHPHAVANRINESGVIAGSDWDRDGVRRPFVLVPDRCQPPPDAGPPEPPPEEPTE